MGSGNVEGGMKCIKWLMMAFNFVFFLVGLLLIVCGAIIMTQFKDYVVVLGSAFNTAPIVIIVVGSIIFCVAFFGCCGSWKENHCMVSTFAALMIFILVLQCFAVIAAFVVRGKVAEIVTGPLKQAINSYYAKNGQQYKNVIDKMQRSMKCCGVEEPADWKNVTGNPSGTYPNSCCANIADTATCSATSNNFHSRGCLKGFESFVSGNIAIVAGVALGVCFVQIIGIMCACCLSRAIKKEYDVV